MIRRPPRSTHNVSSAASDVYKRQFEKFSSLNGPKFYNVPPNKERIKLVSKPNKIVDFIDVFEEENIVGQIKPLHAGETLQWQVDGIVN